MTDTTLPEIVLWAVFGIMLSSSLFFYVLMVRQPTQRRLFHYITIAITLTSSLAYFSMANGLGIGYIEFPHKDGHSTLHYFYYAHYIGAIITVPLTLLDISLVAGIDYVTITLLLVANVYMGFINLVNTIAGPSYKIARWVFLATSFLIYAYQAYTLLTYGMKSASTHSLRVRHLYTYLTIYSLIMWLIYPVVWILSQGVELISSDVEVLSYAGADVLSQAVFGIWLLIAHDQLLLSHHPHGNEVSQDSERARLNPAPNYGSTARH